MWDSSTTAWIACLIVSAIALRAGGYALPDSFVHFLGLADGAWEMCPQSAVHGKVLLLEGLEGLAASAT